MAAIELFCLLNAMLIEGIWNLKNHFSYDRDVEWLPRGNSGRSCGVIQSVMKPIITAPRCTVSQRPFSTME